MVEKTTAMLSMGLDALVKLDADLASRVCQSDEEVDRLNREFCERIESAIERTGEDATTLIHLHAVSRHLERIADHACNIAEDLIYMLSGDIVRHHAVPTSSE
jgi:phosphate transport system protein